jgi:hypothetical protein
MTCGVIGGIDATAMDIFDSELADSPRWNDWIRVSPVQFEGEERPVPRGVRLCCPAARPGDPVQIIDGKRIISTRLVRVAHSILHVATLGINPELGKGALRVRTSHGKSPYMAWRAKDTGECLQFDRLGQVGVEARVERALFILRLSPTRYGNDDHCFL